MVTPEPERIRWVRFAADCAEHVLHLTGTARPQAEAAIKAARAWADDPIEERRQAAEQAARAAAHAAYVAYYTDRADYAANNATLYAADAAANAATDHNAERAWQAERRKFYGLPGG